MGNYSTLFMCGNYDDVAFGDLPMEEEAVDTRGRLINLTMEEAQKECDLFLILYGNRAMTSVRAVKIDGESQKRNKNKDRRRVDVVLVNGVITSVLGVG